MIRYVMVGTNDLLRASRFYDAVLNPLALTRVDSNTDYLAYAAGAASHAIEFYVTRPFDQQPAAHRNGAIGAVAAKSQAIIDGFHQIAFQNGGTYEAPPERGHWIALSIMLTSASPTATRFACSVMDAHLKSVLS